MLQGDAPILLEGVLTDVATFTKLKGWAKKKVIIYKKYVNPQVVLSIL